MRSLFHPPSGRRMASALGLLLVAAAVSGCQEEIEFTRKPLELPQVSSRPVATSPIFVAARTDVEPLQQEIDERIPQQLLRVSLNLSRAACVEKDGRERCSTARVKGNIVRHGTAIIEGTSSGFLIRIPARFELTARGRGRARSVEQTVSGNVMVSAPFTIALDSEWQADVRFSGNVVVEGADAIRILDKPVKISRPIARKLRSRFRRMARAFEEKLDTSKAVQIVEHTWRHLHYPVKLNVEPPLWMRGDPASVAFGGLGASGDGVELRIAIVGKVGTFAGERPLPLLARAMPPLDPDPIAISASHLVMPVDLPYAEIATRIKAAFRKHGPLKSSTSDKAKGFIVKDVSLFPASGRLAMAVSMESEVDGSWQALRGTAYVLGSPIWSADKKTLDLRLAELSAPTQSPVLFDNGKFIIPGDALVAAFREGVKIRLNERFSSILEQTNRAADTEFAGGNRLRGRFDSIGVHSIEAGKNGLRINLDLEGALSVYPAAPTIAAELGASTAVSAEQ